MEAAIILKLQYTWYYMHTHTFIMKYKIITELSKLFTLVTQSLKNIL